MPFFIQVISIYIRRCRPVVKINSGIYLWQLLNPKQSYNINNRYIVKWDRDVGFKSNSLSLMSFKILFAESGNLRITVK
jgi:hypothetical protein